MDYKKFFENVQVHFEMLCTERMRKHAFADKTHDLDFQVFRVLSGYEKAIDEKERGKILLYEAYQSCQTGIMDNSLTKRIQEYLTTGST